MRSIELRCGRRFYLRSPSGKTQGTKGRIHEEESSFLDPHGDFASVYVAKLRHARELHLFAYPVSFFFGFVHESVNLDEAKIEDSNGLHFHLESSGLVTGVCR